MPIATASQTIGPYWHLLDEKNWADLTRFGVDSSEHPGAAQVDAVAPPRDALREQELALPPPLRQAAVGPNDTVPREVIVSGREDKPHQPRRAGVDVAIGPDKPFGDVAYQSDDARTARLEAADG